MRPLTDTLPKPLLKVAGKPLIQYHLEKLAKAGFDNIVINHAWLGEKIEQALGDGAQFDLNIRYSSEGDALETAGGIINALPLLCPSEKHQVFTVINGDVFCDFELSSLPNELAPGHAHLMLVNNPAHNPKGDFALENGYLKLHGNKFTFSGVAVYHKDFFAGLSVKKMPLAPLLREQIGLNNVTGHLHRGKWCDVGTPERLQQLNNSEE